MTVQSAHPAGTSRLTKRAARGARLVSREALCPLSSGLLDLLLPLPQSWEADISHGVFLLPEGPLFSPS